MYFVYWKSIKIYDFVTSDDLQIYTPFYKMQEKAI